MITNCKVCKKQLKFYRKWKSCVNLACIEYNKKLRRYDIVRQNEEVKAEEE